MKTCFWCRSVLKNATKDHVVPRSAGGTETVDCCYLCNQERARITTYFSWQKRVLPKSLRSGRRVKTFEKYLPKRLEIQSIIDKWNDLETSRLGWSPSSALGIISVEELDNLAKIKLRKLNGET